MAVDFFLKLDGIKGESADAKHKDEIDIESFSWGMTQTGSAHGGRRRRRQGLDAGLPLHDAVQHGEPGAHEVVRDGEHIKLGTLTVRKAGKDQQEFLTIKMTDVLVSSYQTSGSEGGDAPSIRSR